jgi:hypothetical protein
MGNSASTTPRVDRHSNLDKLHRELYYYRYYGLNSFYQNEVYKKVWKKTSDDLNALEIIFIPPSLYKDNIRIFYRKMEIMYLDIAKKLINKGIKPSDKFYILFYEYIVSIDIDRMINSALKDSKIYLYLYFTCDKKVKFLMECTELTNFVKPDEEVINRMLILSVVNNDYECVKFFLDNGADKNYKTKNGETAITVANKFRYFNILNLLNEPKTSDMILL